jgi:hypothetical protein
MLEQQCSQLRAHPGQRADVVLVAVGDHHRLYLVAPLGQEGGVRQDLLHAQVCEAAGGRQQERGWKSASKASFKLAGKAA